MCFNCNGDDTNCPTSQKCCFYNSATTPFHYCDSDCTIQCQIHSDCNRNEPFCCDGQCSIRPCPLESCDEDSILPCRTVYLRNEINSMNSLPF